MTTISAKLLELNLPRVNSNESIKRQGMKILGFKENSQHMQSDSLFKKHPSSFFFSKVIEAEKVPQDYIPSTQGLLLTEFIPQTFSSDEISDFRKIVPLLDSSTAINLLRGLIPYASNKDKQQRYKSFLRYSAGEITLDEFKKQVLGTQITETDLINELKEFHENALVRKAAISSVSNKFTSSSVPESRGKLNAGLTEFDSIPSAPSQSKTQVSSTKELKLPTRSIKRFITEPALALKLNIPVVDIPSTNHTEEAPSYQELLKDPRVKLKLLQGKYVEAEDLVGPKAQTARLRTFKDRKIRPSHETAPIFQINQDYAKKCMYLAEVEPRILSAKSSVCDSVAEYRESKDSSYQSQLERKRKKQEAKRLNKYKKMDELKEVVGSDFSQRHSVAAVHVPIRSGGWDSDYEDSKNAKKEYGRREGYQPQESSRDGFRSSSHRGNFSSRR